MRAPSIIGHLPQLDKASCWRRPFWSRRNLEPRKSEQQGKPNGLGQCNGRYGRPFRYGGMPSSARNAEALAVVT